jgi:hypothetical protein
MFSFSRAPRSTRAAAAAGALVAGITVLTVPAIAQADTNGCVTRSEFRRVHNGMAKARIHRLLDTNGRQSSVYTIGRDRYESREYRACHRPRWSLISVDYTNGRVDGKFAYWG